MRDGPNPSASFRPWWRWSSAAAIALANGEQTWLVKHETDSNPGTCVDVATNTDLIAALQCLLDVLAITPADLVWAAA